MVMGSIFWTTTNSFTYNARRMGSWATLLGLCWEYSRHNVCMYLIHSQVQAYVRVLCRLHRRNSTHTRVSHISSTKGKRLGHTPTIHTPLPLPIAFSFARPRGKKLYSISPVRAYKKFLQYFFHSYPLFLFYTIDTLRYLRIYPDTYGYTQIYSDIYFIISEHRVIDYTKPCYLQHDYWYLENSLHYFTEWFVRYNNN
jgi:hypothetical protein